MHMYSYILKHNLEHVFVFNKCLITKGSVKFILLLGLKRSSGDGNQSIFMADNNCTESNPASWFPDRLRIQAAPAVFGELVLHDA